MLNYDEVKSNVEFKGEYLQEDADVLIMEK